MAAREWVGWGPVAWYYWTQTSITKVTYWQHSFRSDSNILPIQNLWPFFPPSLTNLTTLITEQTKFVLCITTLKLKCMSPLSALSSNMYRDQAQHDWGQRETITQMNIYFKLWIPKHCGSFTDQILSVHFNSDEMFNRDGFVLLWGWYRQLLFGSIYNTELMLWYSHNTFNCDLFHVHVSMITAENSSFTYYLKHNRCHTVSPFLDVFINSLTVKA